MGVQEFQLTQQAHVAAEIPIEVDGGNVDMANSNKTEILEDEKWATILEPLTKDTLLDTALAQLETLTAICALVNSQGLHILAWVGEYYRNILRGRITVHVDGTQRRHEAVLTNAKFICALLDASFRNEKLDVFTYERELATAFGKDIDLSNDPHGLCDEADIQISFVNSVQVYLQEDLHAQSQDLSRLNILSWKHLTRALDNLAAALKLPNVQNLPRIHLRRGDCELLRYRLGQAPTNYDVAVKSAPTLIKNAEVYYRGSAKLARNEGAVDEEREASVKEIFAAGIAGNAGNAGNLMELTSNHGMAALEIFEDMRDEGMLSEESIALLGNAIS